MPNTPTRTTAGSARVPADADAALGFLLQLGDSALPTGAFSHSFGMESYLADERIAGPDALHEWLLAYLDTQLTCTEALAVRWVATAEKDPHDVDALLEAATAPAQVRLASRRMGAQLAKLAPELLAEVPAGPWPRHYPAVYGLLGAAAGVPTGRLVHTFLMGSIVSLVQNAVRAVPLGQSAGQRVITALRAPVARAAERVMLLDEGDFATTAPGLEIAQMRHEHLRARMFMS
ncbi:hypothetical protein BJH93_05340 [Kocuria polaris]|nr:hypothetical protein [Kocuria polaris]